jgi:hypothetical protein
MSFSNQDTIKIADTLSNNNKLTIEYAKLYYWFTNEFPIGLDVKVLMYDSIHSSLIDSIIFTTPGHIFLEPAPVDENGVVIRDHLEEKSGVITINHNQASNLMHNSTHLIIATEIQADNLNVVKIMDNSYLYFQLSIDAMCIYTDTLGNGD